MLFVLFVIDFIHQLKFIVTKCHFILGKTRYRAITSATIQEIVHLLQQQQQ